ncbi:MAG TPA: 50S ribosomal protein L10 [Terriglobales bacterium]|nr:50S ribosomal protein L10 [Terriglobales bacterium]
MNRTEKTQNISELQECFERASVALIATGSGLNVATMQKLRRELRKADGEFKVAKNTLARLAIRETSYQGLDSVFRGPTGIIFGYGDPIPVAKVLLKFTQDHDKFAISGGVLEKQVLVAEQVKQLASLPSREVLLAQLMGLLQAPATQLVRLLQEPGARVARLADAIRARAEGSAAASE